MPATSQPKSSRQEAARCKSQIQSLTMAKEVRGGSEEPVVSLVREMDDWSAKFIGYSEKIDQTRGSACESVTSHVIHI